MSNLRGAPLFLRASVVRNLIEGVGEIRRAVVQVPVVPVKLVDRPRRSEDPRLAKANDDTAMDGSGAKVARLKMRSGALPMESAPLVSPEGHGLGAGSNPAPSNQKSGRVAPPVASGLVAVEGEEPAPLDWPDAPLPDHADPDLDRPAPQEDGLEVHHAGECTDDVETVEQRADAESHFASDGSIDTTGAASPARGTRKADGPCCGVILAVDEVARGTRGLPAAQLPGPLDREPEPPLRNLARRKRDQIYYQGRQADARELEQPLDAKAARIALLREAAARAEQRQVKMVAARPSLGVARECRMVAPALPTEVRRKRLDAAIAFLKRQAILVSVSDRTALVRKYRVSGKAESKFAEEVIQIAVDYGMELPA